MLVIAFIATFILGGVVAYVGGLFWATWYANLSFEELSEGGAMLIDAGRNRVSTLTLATDDGYVDVLVLDEK